MHRIFLAKATYAFFFPRLAMSLRKKSLSLELPAREAECATWIIIRLKCFEPRFRLPVRFLSAVW